MKAKVEDGYIELSDIESLSAVKAYLEAGGFAVSENDYSAFGEGLVLNVSPNTKPQPCPTVFTVACSHCGTEATYSGLIETPVREEDKDA